MPAAPDQKLVRSQLDAGLHEHRQGNIEAAAAAYRSALAVAPDHPDALNLLGVALLQLGQPAQAVGYLEQAARTQPDNAGVLANLAQAYFALERYEDAQKAFHAADHLDPRAAQFQLGAANSLAMQGKLGDAETLLRKLAGRFPQEALVWFNLGNVLRDQGRVADALADFRRAAELDPRLVEARNNLAGALHALQRFDEAEREYRACIRMAPDYVLAQCNLASVVIDLGRFGEAEELCRAAIRRAPDLAQAHTFLGAALDHQGRLLEALECHRMAAELSPQDPKAIENYAAALAGTGRFTAGRRGFVHALTLNPQSVSTHRFFGMTLLAHGCLADGWVEYGHRPACERLREKHPAVPLARTLPPELAGKRLCLLREQGLGDEIFFLRYAPQLKAAGARIAYRASNKIGTLLSRIPCIERLSEETEPLPEADAALLVGDLPHALSVYPASPLPSIDAAAKNHAPLRDFPSKIAAFFPAIPPSLALTPLEAQLARIRKRLTEAGPQPYLGLTWRGGTPPQEQRGVAWVLHKEIGIPPLAAALKNFPGTFIALQRNPAAGEIAVLSGALGRPVHDFTDLNNDLEGMLALLAVIDEYIGVSNTNMHLRAGAGRTARVLVPCPAEWRWLHAGRSSPWFPGFAIYRQSSRGDWRDALQALGRDLAANGR